VDLLAREVGAIVEAIEDGRLYQLAGDAHHFTVAKGMAAGGQQADAPVHRLRDAVEPDGARVDVEPLATVPTERIAGDETADSHRRPIGAFAGSVMVDQIGGLKTGKGRTGGEPESPAQGGEQDCSVQPGGRRGARRGKAGRNGPAQRGRGPGRDGRVEPQADWNRREGGDPIQVADAAAKPRPLPENVAGGDADMIGYGKIEQFQWTRLTRGLV